jgi:predicted O-methyltransferase YrrM
MIRWDIDALVLKYARTEGLGSNEGWLNHSTQFDDRSAEINYSLVREFKPKVVVEFGTRTGRCTHDILKALLINGEKFTYKPYELEDGMRVAAQSEINRIFKENAPTIGGDITKASDIPDGIDYLFIDNYHDLDTTKWVFDTLIHKCKPGALVQIHDWSLKGDFERTEWGNLKETDYVLELHQSGKLPLKKFYWTIDEGDLNKQSSWWIYEPI